MRALSRAANWTGTERQPAMSYKILAGLLMGPWSSVYDHGVHELMKFVDLRSGSTTCQENT